MDGFVVHRLGTALCLAAAVLGVASVCAARVRSRAARRRIEAVLPVRRPVRGPGLGSRIRGAVAGWAGPAGALLVEAGC